MYFFFSENIHHPLETEEIMDLTVFATLQRLHQFINFASFLHDRVMYACVLRQWEFLCYVFESRCECCFLVKARPADSFCHAAVP